MKILYKMICTGLVLFLISRQVNINENYKSCMSCTRLIPFLILGLVNYITHLRKVI